MTKFIVGIDQSKTMTGIVIVDADKIINDNPVVLSTAIVQAGGMSDVEMANVLSDAFRKLHAEHGNDIKSIAYEDIAFSKNYNACKAMSTIAGIVVGVCTMLWPHVYKTAVPPKKAKKLMEPQQNVIDAYINNLPKNNKQHKTKDFIVAYFNNNVSFANKKEKDKYISFSRAKKEAVADAFAVAKFVAKGSLQ